MQLLVSSQLKETAPAPSLSISLYFPLSILCLLSPSLSSIFFPLCPPISVFFFFSTLSRSPLRVVIYEALFFDVAQGQMNGAPNETRTHSCGFTSLAC